MRENLWKMRDKNILAAIRDDNGADLDWIQIRFHDQDPNSNSNPHI